MKRLFALSLLVAGEPKDGDELRHVYQASVAYRGAAQTLRWAPW